MTGSYWHVHTLMSCSLFQPLICSSPCRHNLFNIRYQFAVFEPGAKPQYRLHDRLPNARTDFGSPPLSKLGKKTYRGPQLNRLFPPDMTGNGCPRQLLLVLEVPGLPEVSPTSCWQHYISSNAPPVWAEQAQEQLPL